MSIPFERYEKAAAFIRERLGKSVSPMPEVCLVLGSGLGRLAGEVTDPVEIPYEEIPGFPCSTVKSHAGKLVAGRLSGRPVAVMAGRRVSVQEPLARANLPAVRRTLGFDG